MQLTCGRSAIARYSSLAYTTAKQRGEWSLAPLRSHCSSSVSLCLSLYSQSFVVGGGAGVPTIAVMEAQLTWHHDRLPGKKRGGHLLCVTAVNNMAAASLDRRMALLLLPHLLSTRSARRVGRQDMYERAIFESRRAVYAVLCL